MGVEGGGKRWGWGAVGRGVQLKDIPLWRMKRYSSLAYEKLNTRDFKIFRHNATFKLHFCFFRFK